MTVLQSFEGHTTNDFGSVWTHKGKIRPYQEDAAYVGLDFMVVADGMGGQDRGDEASRVAVEAAVHVLNRTTNFPDRAIGLAFTAAQDAVAQVPRRSVMPWTWPATTLLILLKDFDGRLHWGHLGDSRIYTHGPAGLQQVTTDHENYDGSILRYVGGTHDVPDIGVIDANVTTVILCSDGLFLDLDETQISALSALNQTASQLAEQLVEGAAVIGQGRDNVTVGVVKL